MIKVKVRKELSDYIIRPAFNILYKFRYSYIASPTKTLLIPIGIINSWYRGNRFSEFTFPGIIKGGNWDNRITRKEKVLRKSAKYHGIIQRFRENTPWIETDLFQKRYKSQIDKGIQVKGFDDLEQLEQYYINTYDKLFERLKTDGVKSPSDQNPDIGPMYIILYKEGEIFYTVEGNHRLFMCMVLGIEEIPVRVWMRHTEWQEKREYILSRKGKNIKPEYRKYLSHPDIVSELPGD